jgi:hypothetical protein
MKGKSKSGEDSLQIKKRNNKRVLIAYNLGSQWQHADDPEHVARLLWQVQSSFSPMQPWRED